MKEPGLPGQHAGHADFREELEHLIRRREGRAVVAQGDLDAEAFRNREDVHLRASRDRRRGIGVVARPHPARSAFDREAAHLGKEILDRARHAVGARDAQEARNAALHEGGEVEFRAAARPAAFAAAAGNVDVLVDETRRYGASGSVNRFHAGNVRVEAVIDGDDFSPGNKNVAMADMFRSVKIRVADESCNAHCGVSEKMRRLIEEPPDCAQSRKRIF